MKNQTILVINDAPVQLELLVFILGQAGYRVLAADNAIEGIKTAKGESPDLIISDVMMPEMDGIELCRKIRADESFSETPFLLVSALRKDTESVVAGFEAGADDYIEVPFEPVRLVTKVAQLIERGRVNKATRESESQFRTIFDNAAIGIALVNENGFPIKTNPALRKMLGYTDEELCRRSFIEITHPDDINKDQALTQELFEGKRAYFQIEKRYIKKDGSVMWANLTASVIHQFGNEDRVAVGMVEDITDRKFAYSALIESEERFRAQYKGIPIPTCTWKNLEDDFVLVDYNDAALELSRGKLAKYVGTKASEFYKEAPEIVEDLRRCFNEKTIIRREVPFKLVTTGELKHMDISYVFISPDIVMAHYRDVTAQREAEESLRNSEERFHLASLATNDALWDRDLIKNTAWMSENYYYLLGYSPREGGPTFDLWKQAVHPEDLERVLASNQAVLDSGERYLINEYRLRTADGSYAYILDRGYVLYDDDGKPCRIIGAAMNITERKKTEDALRESREHLALAQEAARIGSFDLNLQTGLGVVSPELKSLYGVSSDYEETLQSWLNLIHPDDLEEVKLQLQESLESGVINSDFRIIRPDGKVLWLHGKGKVLYDEKGEPLKMVGIHLDVTERKENETKLHFQKSLLEAQSEASIDGILVVAPSGEIISYNRRFAEMWEIAEDVLNTKCDEKFIEAVVDKLVDPDEFLGAVSYLYDHPSFRDQVEIYLKDGRIFERYTSPVADTDQTYFGRVWFFRDITKRKQTGEAIRFQAHLLDTVEQAVIASDLSDTVIYWNKYAEKLYGWSVDEAIGRRVGELTTPDISKNKAAVIMNQLRAGESWSGEFMVRDKNGRTFPALICDSPVFDEKGNLIGIVGVSTDISEQKQAEKALAEANERAIREYDRLLRRLSNLAQTSGAARDLTTVFRSILDFSRASFPCLTLVVSLYEKENKQCRVIYLWHDGEEHSESNFESISIDSGFIGKAINTGEVITVSDYSDVVAEEAANINYAFEKSNHQPRSAIIAPMKIMGNVVGLIEVQSEQSAAFTQEHATALQLAANVAASAIENVRLLEQERQNAEQLRQSQKLESVGRLAGGIAHDFNNMLTAINGYSDLALRRLAEDDPLRHYVEEIKKAGERSATLTHQLLAFSRQQVLKPKLLNLNEIIVDTCKMLQRLIGEDIHLRIIPDSELGLVEADPVQLTQVILNLAVNARDAMPRGGDLIIETSNVYLDEKFASSHSPTSVGSYVLLSVKDTGSGMSDEIKDHIFEPFYTTKEIGKGTGLGLSTVYGIVKQSGGYIWMESEINEGTTFNVYLPLVKRRDKSISGETSANGASSKGTETILLVEDEDIVKNLARRILQECGYDVIEAHNGVQAMEIFKQSDRKIDLLITDVVMPEMGGRELAEKLKETRPDLKVLFMSGYTDDAVIRHGIVEDNTKFIQKPFTLESLSARVRLVLDENKISA